MAGDKLVQSNPLNLKIIKKSPSSPKKYTFLLENLYCSRKNIIFAHFLRFATGTIGNTVKTLLTKA